MAETQRTENEKSREKKKRVKIPRGPEPRERKVWYGEREEKREKREQKEIPESKRQVEESRDPGRRNPSQAEKRDMYHPVQVREECRTSEKKPKAERRESCTVAERG